MDWDGFSDQGFRPHPRGVCYPGKIIDGGEKKAKHSGQNVVIGRAMLQRSHKAGRGVGGSGGGAAEESQRWEEGRMVVEEEEMVLLVASAAGRLGHQLPPLPLPLVSSAGPPPPPPSSSSSPATLLQLRQPLAARQPRRQVEAETMREIVHIQAGQCGNQIGAKVGWAEEILEWLKKKV